MSRQLNGSHDASSVRQVELPQVAGHGAAGSRSPSLGVTRWLHKGHDCVTKHAYRQGEARFYEEMYPRLPASTRGLLPRFYGFRFDGGGRIAACGQRQATMGQPFPAEAPTLVVFEDLAPFKQPCVADIKIGNNHVAPSMREHKREKTKRTDTSTSTHKYGIRMEGLTFIDAKGRRVNRDRVVSPTRDLDDMTDAMRDFLGFPHRPRLDVLQHFIERLETMRRDQFLERLQPYGASLLLSYDHDAPLCDAVSLATGQTDSTQPEGAAVAARARLIDFAYCYLTDKVPEHERNNLQLGFQSLLGILHRLQREARSGSVA